MARDTAETSPLDGLQRIGEFEILREIGRGSMGVVFEARQLSLNRQVALKVLDASGKSTRAIERFRREAAAAARLNHPGIVPVWAVGQDRGMLFYAMQLVQGRTLRELIHERPGGLEPARAALLGLRIAEALEYAHREGVIHRDVKPANIIVTAGDQPVLTDFGLAKVLSLEQLTQAGVLLGTPTHMAPEQARGDTQIDHRVDVYGLGVCLYEMLTGQLPFTADSLDALLRKIVREPPLRPRRLNPAIPRALEAVVLKCMHKQREQRYGSAAEVAAELRRFLRGERVMAERPGALAQLRRYCRTHPGAAGALAVLLLAAGALAAWQAHRSGLRPAWSWPPWRMLRSGGEQPAATSLSTASAPARHQAGRATPPPAAAAPPPAPAAAPQAAASAAAPGATGAGAPTPAASAAAPAPAGAELVAAAPADQGLAERRLQEALRARRRAEAQRWLERAEQALARAGSLPGTEARRAETEALLAYAAALGLEPDNPSARRGCARIFFARGLAAERRGEAELAALWFGLVREYDPEGAFVPELEPAGTLALQTRPPVAAQLTLERMVEDRTSGVLVREVVAAGLPSPLAPRRLAAGSYQITIQAEGFAPAVVPLLVERGDELALEVRLLRPEQIPPGFVYVPAGPFIAGGDPQAVRAGPRRRLELAGFFIARHEVTVAEYAEFLNALPVEQARALLPRGSARQAHAALFWPDAQGRWQYPPAWPAERPVSGVSLEAAERYARWRGARLGAPLRLPNELEWEKACRGADGRPYPWGTAPPFGRAHLPAGAEPIAPAPVGTSPADVSVFGVHDLIGNVAEWTSSRFDPSGHLPHRVVRGGSFWPAPDPPRAAARLPHEPDSFPGHVGIRLACDLPPE
ncbi:MAG: hypothetical protein KatS3mg102_0686 [Planctomycetota bacterium]|nr:MAG: hypothetical protein KatS3mg102_0686 [Planctomycetota bacterium]